MEFQFIKVHSNITFTLTFSNFFGFLQIHSKSILPQRSNPRCWGNKEESLWSPSILIFHYISFGYLYVYTKVWKHRCKRLLCPSAFSWQLHHGLMLSPQLPSAWELKTMQYKWSLPMSAQVWTSPLQDRWMGYPIWKRWKNYIVENA